MMTSVPQEASQTLPDKAAAVGRMEALSDGVFGVALTLLVIDIKISDEAGANAFDTIYHLVPQILIYVISYLVVGYTWMWHHLIFALIARSTRLLMWLNILLLLPVAFLPFATSFVSKYPTSGVAVAVYGADISWFSVLLVIVWNYAKKQGLLAAELDLATIKVTTKRTHILVLLSLTSTLIGVFYPIAGLLLFGLAPIGYILTGGRHTSA
jgi:TMEM175 potassium channel family protein